jgi:hypothetical protein
LAIKRLQNGIQYREKLTKHFIALHHVHTILNVEDNEALGYLKDEYKIQKEEMN